MGNRFTDWLGDMSYTVYLLHMPVGYLCDSVIKRVTSIHEQAWGRVALFCLFVGVAYASAWALHVIAERPLLKRLKRISIRARVPALKA
ncbi:MAG: acyltransferase family protein, partial [Flavobacteriales bacterium]|nr:acyltransferase family protein [Flavobacteriales bacterium]